MKRSSAAAFAVLISTAWLPSMAVASTITDVTPAHDATAGGRTITINGTAFSAAGNSASVGGRACPITLEASERIECTLPEGSGAFQPLQILDGSGTGSPPFAFGYDAPTITDVAPASAATRGGTSITINGNNFGPNGIARSVSVGGVDCPLEAGAAGSHTKIRCTLPPGAGHDLSVTVTADGQRSSSLATISYDPPSLTAIAPTSAPAEGGVRLTVYGNNFGLRAVATVGTADCPVDVQTHTQLECTLPPGTGTAVDVHVTTGGQSSGSLPFSYATVASKCDAAKSKASGDFAKCLAGVQAKAAKKGVGGDHAAIAKCEEKIDKACAKAESSADDCSQLGTCDAIKRGTKDWDGLIYGNVR